MIKNFDKFIVYVEETVVSDGKILVMDQFVLNLRFGDGHQISCSGLYVFLIVSLKVFHLHCGNFSIKSRKQGHHEIFFTLCPEIQISEHKEPSVGGSSSEHVQIFGVGDESKGNESTPKNQGVSSGEAEMFIMGRYLFGSLNIHSCLEEFHCSWVYWFVRVIEWMNVGFLSASLDLIH